MITEENSVSESGIVTAADGTLVIIVCRAKHLPNRRKLDKQNPYCTLRIGTLANKTPADFRGGQTPEWTSEVRFQLSRERKPILKIDVLDETKNDPTPIGSGEIDCTPVFVKSEDGKHIYDGWHPLSLNGRQAGIIYLEMTFYPSAPIVPSKFSDDEPHTVRRVINSTFTIPEQVHHYPENEPISYVPSMHSRGSLLEASIHNTSGNRSLSPSPGNSYSSNKHSPVPPPVHPSRKPDPTVGVFVDGKSEKKSWKKSPLFSKPVKSSNEYAEVDEPSENETKSRLLRLANKLNSHEPVSTLWKNPSKKGHSPSESIGSDVYTATPNFGNLKPSQDLEILQKEVQQDWNIGRNHNIYGDDTDLFKKSLNSRLSSVTDLPIIPPSTNKPLHFDTASDDDDDDDDDGSIAPPPPPHNSSSMSFEPFVPSINSRKTNHGRKPPMRKPPPPASTYNDINTEMSALNIRSVPFSADDIGAEDNESVVDHSRKVYLFDQEVSTIDHGEETEDNRDEIYEASYFAPVPDQILSKNMRLEYGNLREDDLDIDPGVSGYLGSGTWDTESAAASFRGNVSATSTNNDFSPTIFDRKPNIPPKIPIGLTEKEYYILEKDQYLRDINGDRR